MTGIVETMTRIQLPALPMSVSFQYWHVSWMVIMGMSMKPRLRIMLLPRGMASCVSGMSLRITRVVSRSRILAIVAKKIGTGSRPVSRVFMIAVFT